MNAATIFKTLTTVTLSITLLMTGGCNNMETKKEETGKNTAIENIFARKERPCLYIPTDRKRESGLISKSCYGCTDSSKQAALGFRGSG